VLASGDVHGDGPDDLVVADPAFGCHDPGRPDYGSGVVVLLPGSARGLTTSDSQLWTQDSPGVDGAERLGNLFGEALAMGPLDRGDTADLAIGAPGDGTGSVTVLLGGAKGLSTAGIGGTRYTQATPGIVGTAEAGDRFGDTVTTAPVQNQSQASLIIGVPGEDVGSVTDAGSVTQLSISRTGPDPRGSRTFTANTPGVKGKAGRFDHFGDSTHHWG
ncbi:MAG: hypothetical protein L0H41_15845, partial [Microlunatus sp.]|nr:hypothetical protein [Microlunatus sp.]